LALGELTVTTEPAAAVDLDGFARWRTQWRYLNLLRCHGSDEDLTGHRGALAFYANVPIARLVGAGVEFLEPERTRIDQVRSRK
jgi:hypothetical protein